MDNLLGGGNNGTWRKSEIIELGCLVNGVNVHVCVTNNINFIRNERVPEIQKVTYTNFICDHRPLKPEPLQVRLNVGGYRLDLYDETASPTKSLLESKIFLNIIIADSDRAAHLFPCDLRDPTLHTLINRPEYMRNHSRYFSP